MTSRSSRRQSKRERWYDVPPLSLGLSAAATAGHLFLLALVLITSLISHMTYSLSISHMRKFDARAKKNLAGAPRNGAAGGHARPHRGGAAGRRGSFGFRPARNRARAGATRGRGNRVKIESRVITFDSGLDSAL